MSKDSGRLSPENTVVTIVATDPQRAQAGKEACLVVIIGDEIGKRVRLEEADVLIGRASTTDIQLDMDNVSRNHAMVTRTALGWVLRDLGLHQRHLRQRRRSSRARRLRTAISSRSGATMLKFLPGGNVEAQYHEEIYRLMTIDGLTQMHNKRHLHESLEREFARSKRYGKPFALVMFDIDHFKKINDTYGHLAGDDVLRSMGALLQEARAPQRHRGPRGRRRVRGDSARSRQAWRRSRWPRSFAVWSKPSTVRVTTASDPGDDQPGRRGSSPEFDEQPRRWSAKPTRSSTKPSAVAATASVPTGSLSPAWHA